MLKSTIPPCRDMFERLELSNYAFMRLLEIMLVKQCHCILKPNGYSWWVKYYGLVLCVCGGCGVGGGCDGESLIWCLRGLCSCPVSHLESHSPKKKVGRNPQWNPPTQEPCIPHIFYWPHRRDFSNLNKDSKWKFKSTMVSQPFWSLIPTMLLI